jgi:hypothetical protein
MINLDFQNDSEFYELLRVICTVGINISVNGYYNIFLSKINL